MLLRRIFSDNLAQVLICCTEKGAQQISYMMDLLQHSPEFDPSLGCWEFIEICEKQHLLFVTIHFQIWHGQVPSSTFPVIVRSQKECSSSFWISDKRNRALEVWLSRKFNCQNSFYRARLSRTRKQIMVLKDCRISPTEINYDTHATFVCAFRQ